MNLNSTGNLNRNILLGVILAIAALLRFYHLSFQSFGLDELHTMNEADPHLRRGCRAGPPFCRDGLRVSTDG